MPNDNVIGHGPLPPNAAVPSGGIPAPAPSRMSAEEELRQLAARYVQNPDLRVDRVRVRHSRRSGKVKVMMLLEYQGNDGIGPHYPPTVTVGNDSDLHIAPGTLRPEYYPPLAPLYVCLSLYQVHMLLF
jgi:hypothetical protein